MLGGGMMLQDCTRCDGVGKIQSEPQAKVVEKPDKRSKTYKEAILKIMEIKDCSKEDAVIEFDKQYEKL